VGAEASTTRRCSSKAATTAVASTTTAATAVMALRVSAACEDDRQSCCNDEFLHRRYSPLDDRSILLPHRNNARHYYAFGGLIRFRFAACCSAILWCLQKKAPVLELGQVGIHNRFKRATRNIIVNGFTNHQSLNN
jgi:hypothetical protein